MTEAEFRKAMGLSASQEVLYRAADGAATSYTDFGRQVYAGGAFQVEKTAQGAVVLRLNAPTSPASSRSLPVSLPAWSFTTLAGRPLRSTDFADRPLLLSFFYSKCVPCIQETPILNAFARKHPEYHYLAITFDPREEAERFVQQYNLTWPVVTDAQAFISAAGVGSYPAYLLVAQQGRILAHRSGLDARAAADPGIGLKLFEQWVRAAH